jgi:hypothetical protein
MKLQDGLEEYVPIDCAAEWKLHVILIVDSDLVWKVKKFRRLVGCFAQVKNCLFVKARVGLVCSGLAWLGKVRFALSGLVIVIIDVN